MADERARPDRQQARAAAAAAPSETSPEEVRYTVEELVENARGLLGVKRAAVVGGLAGESRKSFTLTEATDAVNAFLKRAPEMDNVPEPEEA